MPGQRIAYNDMENEQKIEVKKKQIKKFFKDLPPEKAKFADVLMQQFAVTSVLLERLVEEINTGDAIEYFVQGAQRIRRENPAIKSYNTTMKSLTSLTKSLVEMLPDKAQRQAGEDIMKFAANLRQPEASKR